MNAQILQVALPHMRPVLSHVGPGQLSLHDSSKFLAQSVVETLEDMRQASKKLAISALQMGGELGRLCLAVLEGIWRMIINMIRALASIFGMKRGSANDSRQDTREDVAQHAPNPFAAVSAKKQASENGSHVPAAIDATVQEAQSLISTVSEKTSESDNNAFLSALRYAGLNNTDAGFLSYLQEDGIFSNAVESDSMLKRGFLSANDALSSLDSQIVSTQASRSHVASILAQSHNPPIHVSDLVKFYRANLKYAPPADLSNIQQLIAADDELVVLSAHKQMIRESMLLMSFAAENTGIDTSHLDALKTSVLGHDWPERQGALKSDVDSATSGRAQDSNPATMGGEAGEKARAVYVDTIAKIGQRIKNDAVPPAAAAESPTTALTPLLPGNQSTPLTPAEQSAEFFTTPQDAVPVVPIASMNSADRLRLLSAQSRPLSDQYFIPGQDNSPAPDTAPFPK